MGPVTEKLRPETCADTGTNNKLEPEERKVRDGT